MDTGTNVVMTIPGRESHEATYIIEEDNISHTFAILAYGMCGKDEMQKSDLGDMIPWCYSPPKPEIIDIGIMGINTNE